MWFLFYFYVKIIASFFLLVVKCEMIIRCEFNERWSYFSFIFVLHFVYFVLFLTWFEYENWWKEKLAFFFDGILFFALSEMILRHQQHATDQICCWDALCSTDLSTNQISVGFIQFFSIRQKQKYEIFKVQNSLVSFRILDNLIRVDTICGHRNII